MPDLSDEINVLVMSIAPGHAGSSFHDVALRTVERAIGPARDVGLDGGVTSAVAPRALVAGATWLVSGSDLVSSADPHDWLVRAGARPDPRAATAP